jgi:sarcosine oxidase subunit beta
MRTAQVAIVGGGVIGCSVAYHLAAAGQHDVALLERGTLAGGVTGVCPGGIRQQFEGESECRFAQRSVRFFERSGYLFLAETGAVLNRYRQNVAMQNRLGIPSRILSASDIHTLLPNLTMARIAGGSYCAEDGFIEDCHGVTTQLAARARQRGARFLREEVGQIERAGSRWLVTTDVGTLETEQLVIAAGADSVELAAQAGVSLPIVPERRRLAYTMPCEPGILPPLVIAIERGVAAKQLANGVLYLGWLAEPPGADDLTFIERTMQAGATLLARLGDVPVRRVMAGIYDNTPDRRPLLGRVAGAPGLFLAAGFSGHGFMIAPAVGEALAAALTGRSTDLPLGDFTLDRFAGAAPREGLQI